MRKRDVEQTAGRRRRAARRAVLAVALSAVLSGHAAEEGIFADFQTSLGNFTCTLEYTQAPQAVANFIGLAGGQRAWLDVSSGAVRRRPFFDGLTFHRVIAGFMIQGGSPNGEGTDGPGYALLDEFDPDLRHDAAGVLSMANSGPNSGGAQFFVTVAPTPWLDDVHTIFGRVSAGLDTVLAISQVETDEKDRPKTPVVLERVAIRRVGAAAEAFDITAQGLPVVSAAELRVERGAGGVNLRFDSAPWVESFLQSSPALGEWSATSLGLDLAEPALTEVTRETAGTAGFFALSQVHYSTSTRAPRSLQGRALVLKFTGSTDVLTVRFDDTGGGAYDFNGTAGEVVRHTWRQEPYRGRLWPIEFSALVPMTLRLDFADEAGGSFSGTAYSAQPFSVSGNFTLSAP